MHIQAKHLLFYDGQCGLCDRAVQCVLALDHKRRFIFAPLQGQTANTQLQQLPATLRHLDSLILIENFQGPNRRLYVMSRAVFRICWLLGGLWVLIGWLSFLPGWLFDWAYRLIARHRHRLFSQAECILPDPAERNRFLD